MPCSGTQLLNRFKRFKAQRCGSEKDPEGLVSRVKGPRSGARIVQNGSTTGYLSTE